MANLVQQLKLAPFRTVQDFIGGNQWTVPTFNPNELVQLQKQIVSNLIYYQTNYGAIAIPFLLLVAFFRPTAILFGLVVLAVLLAGFVYSTRQNAQLTALLHDRPIAILLFLLIAAFFVIKLFGTAFVFLFGIALPLGLIVVHAAVRTPSLQNKATNAVENLSLQTTPMGLLLSWLGAKQAEEQPATTTKRNK